MRNNIRDTKKSPRNDNDRENLQERFIEDYSEVYKYEIEDGQLPHITLRIGLFERVSDDI